MSSSAPKQQLSSEPPLFSYPDAGVPGGAPGSGPEAGQGPEVDVRKRQAEAFEQGRQSARQEFRAELDATIAKNRAEIGQALQQFVLERQNYYHRIEGEVVRLALAIARKILHREVQIDPNTLAGIVLVTLEKLNSSTKVNLHVHPREAPDWRHYFACQTEGFQVPEVHEDPTIAPGECRIETSVGSTEVGLELQLKEIETGLLDLLAERPGAIPSSLPAVVASVATPALLEPKPSAGGALK